MRNHLPIIIGKRPYPGPWIAPTWVRSEAGLWTNPGIVPGAEILVDGGLEATYTAGLCDSLSGIGTFIESADAHSGSKAQQFTAAGQYYRAQFPDTGAVIAGQWYRASGWTKRTAGATDQVQFRLQANDDTNVTSKVITSATYEQKIIISRALATTPWRLYITYDASLGPYDTVIVDECSLVPLPIISQLLAYRNYGRQVEIASALTMSGNIPGGVVSRLSVNGDGTLNFVMCWHDGTKLRLDTVFNDTTVVSKVDATVAYGATKAPAIKWAGPDTAQAFYGTLGSEVQVGLDADVSALPPGPFAGLFMPGPGYLGDPVVT